MSVAQQLSPEAKWKLAVEMPIDRLMAIVRGQPSEIDAPTAISALQYKQKEQTASQGVLAQQQLQGKPKVADSLMQGLTRIPAPNMETMQAANGGIVGYADGGDVRHFQVGGRTPFDEDIMRQRVIDAARARTAAIRAAPPPAPAPVSAPVSVPVSTKKNKFLTGLSGVRTYGLPGLVSAAGMNAYDTFDIPTDVMRRYFETDKEDPSFMGDVGTRLRALVPAFMGGGDDKKMREIMEADAQKTRAASGVSAAVPPVDTNDARAIAQDMQEGRGIALRRSDTLRSDVPRSDINAAEAAAMDARYKAEGEFGSEQQRAGIATLAQSPSFAETTAGAVTGRVDSNFTKAMREITGNTDSYLDAMTAAFRKMTPTEEERKVRGNEKKGVMALKVAQQLLQPGRSSAAAWGGAAGEIATLTQAYADEDRKDKKDMLGAEINMLGAQAQLAQGNTKIAVDMYQHAERLVVDTARAAADAAYKETMASLQGQQLTELARHNKAQEAANAERNKIHAIHEVNVGKHLDMKGAVAKTLTPQQTATAYTNATRIIDAMLKSPGALFSLRKNNSGKSDAEIRDMLITEQFNKATGRTSETITPYRSIQIQENAVDAGKRIYD